MSGILKKKIYKYVEFFLTKIKILYAQRKYVSDGITVKYMYKKVRNSKGLVIVFSACTRNGIKARYNYVRTLNGLECNRLYILDDWSDDHRGSYYLGPDFTFKEESATRSLINKFILEQESDKVIFCGSSKGGYAALNFGVQFKNAIIITGGPQYHLYTYLKNGNESALRHIMGNFSEEKAKAIDEHLKNRLESDLYISSQKIYIHYSDKEHTYTEHIYDLLIELKKLGFDINEDVADYANHSDISYYFPDFLIRQIKLIL